MIGQQNGGAHNRGLEVESAAAATGITQTGSYGSATGAAHAQPGCRCSATTVV
jgi:hypothetical protein